MTNLQYTTGHGASALDQQQERDRLDGYAVVSGYGISPGTGLEVDVASGTALFGVDGNGDANAVSSGTTQNVALASADSSNPRKDVIYVQSDGTVTKETGVARSELPTDATRFNTYKPEPYSMHDIEGVVLAEVWVGAGETSLSTNDIRDRRMSATATHEQLITKALAAAEIESGSTAHGQNPAETITDSSSPKDLSFAGSDDRDIHDRTDVTISNSSGASATEDITVTLYDGTDNTGTQLASETLSITVADASSTTETFITGDEPLDNGDYFIEVTQSGTALTIDSTSEFTKGAKHSISQSTTGDLEITNQDGVTEASIDPISGGSTFSSVSTDDAQFDGTPWVDVRNYGAVGDGSTDDSAAIQSAVDAASPGGSIYFPPGTYYVTTTISGLHQTRIVGPESRGHRYWYQQDGVTFKSTEADLGDGGAIFKLSSDGTSVQDIGFYNVGFVGDSSVDPADLSNAQQTGAIAIDINGVKNGLTVDSCRFNSLKQGIGNSGSTYVGHTTVENCYFDQNTEAINTSTTVPLVIENCGFYNHYDWINADEIAVRGCTFQNDSYATDRTNISGQSIHAEDNWFEGGNDFLDCEGYTNGRIIAQNNHFGAGQASGGGLKHMFRIGPAASVEAVGNYGETNNRILRGDAVTDWTTVTVDFRGNQWKTYNWYSGHGSPGEEGARFVSIDPDRSVITNMGEFGLRGPTGGVSRAEAREANHSDTATYQSLFSVGSGSAGEATVALTDTTGETDIGGLFTAYWSINGTGSGETAVVEQLNNANMGLDVQWNGTTLEWSPRNQFGNIVTCKVDALGSAVTWQV